MSSCRLRCLRVPIAMPGFYRQSLWILQYFLARNQDFYHRLLDLDYVQRINNAFLRQL
jgi:hypothetical protein